jgi:hypothetical protein
MKIWWGYIYIAIKATETAVLLFPSGVSKHDILGPKESLFPTSTKTLIIFSFPTNFPNPLIDDGDKNASAQIKRQPRRVVRPKSIDEPMSWGVVHDAAPIVRNPPVPVGGGIVV